MNKIKSGDEVIVLTGKSRGERGRVTRVLLQDNKIVVEGINLIKRHTKPNPNAGIEGGIVEKEAALHVSNVALFNPATGKADRVGFKFLEDGKKVRYFKSNGDLV
ncbi:MAG: 50S ribosomal protein L24 [Gammaproteobacteria bacterium CG22_combo_CG10-13_8_21_14_all_40_8]|nr:MAG: 50S ribosomal protein L24 [Gammaproteobacteria bacterium CG22_combo_CG10-13_8_21_14_all_40_8]